MKRTIFVFLLILFIGIGLLVAIDSMKKRNSQELLLVTSIIADVNSIFCDFTRCELEEKQERYAQLSNLCTGQFLQKLQEIAFSHPLDEAFPSWEVTSLEVKTEEDGVSNVSVSENRPGGRLYIFSLKRNNSTFLLDNIEEVKNFL